MVRCKRFEVAGLGLRMICGHDGSNETEGIQTAIVPREIEVTFLAFLSSAATEIQLFLFEFLHNQTLYLVV